VNVRKLILRFLTPPILVTVRAFLKYRCLVSPRAEVELTRNLTIGRGTVVGSFTKLKSSEGRLRIGAHVEIATSCTITSHAGGVGIGDRCMIGPGVCIIGNNYRYDQLDVPIQLQEKVSKAGVRIADNVWIGANSTLLDGADIGAGAIIAANSVVASQIPANAIAQGSPAKVLFMRR
jgi:acetyltransferase-like isoleucine patch superfamily enzyme